MFRKIEIRYDAMLSLDCEGVYLSGTEPWYDHGFGNWLPGEPESIIDFKIFLPPTEKAKEPIEITNYIPAELYKELYEVFLKEAGEESK